MDELLLRQMLAQALRNRTPQQQGDYAPMPTDRTVMGMNVRAAPMPSPNITPQSYNGMMVSAVPMPSPQIPKRLTFEEMKGLFSGYK